MRKLQFTLIELLVAISLLTVLSYVLSYTYSEVAQLGVRQAGLSEMGHRTVSIAQALEYDLEKMEPFAEDPDVDDAYKFTYAAVDGYEYYIFPRTASTLDIPKGVAGYEYVGLVFGRANPTDEMRVLSRFRGGAGAELSGGKFPDKLGVVRSPPSSIPIYGHDSELMHKHTIAKDVIDFEIGFSFNTSAPYSFTSMRLVPVVDAVPTAIQITLSISASVGDPYIRYDGNDIPSMERMGFRRYAQSIMYNVSQDCMVDYDGNDGFSTRAYHLGLNSLGVGDELLQGIKIIYTIKL